MATDTQTEMELPDYMWEPRAEARIAAAAAAIDAAEAQEAEASEAVDVARASHAEGLVPRGVLLISQRKLAANQEALATAQAVGRRVERTIAKEREDRHRRRIAEQWAAQAAYRAQRTASLERAASLWSAIDAALAELDNLPGLTPLRTYSHDFARLRDALSRLRGHYN